MKILVNKDYGGFDLSDAVYEKIGNDWDGSRDDPKLIAAVEKIGLKKSGGYNAHLAIVKIPDEATDWDIDEYDGWESVIYVVDGKIHYS